MSEFADAYNALLTRLNPLLGATAELSSATLSSFSKKYSAADLTNLLQELNVFIQTNFLESILSKASAAEQQAFNDFLSKLFFNDLAMIPSDLKDSQGHLLYPREIPENLYTVLKNMNKKELSEKNFEKIRHKVNKELLLNIITNARLGNFLPIKGNSGSYSIIMKEPENDAWKTTYLAIAKPTIEEPLAHANPFRSQRLKRWFAQRFHFTALQTQAGQGVYGEAAAYTTAHWVAKNFETKQPSDIVPYTCVIKDFKLPNNKNIVNKKIEPHFRTETVSLQLGVNLENPLEHKQDITFNTPIEAEKLFHISHHYNKKPIPPRFEKIKNFFRRLFGLPVEESPWKKDGKWIESSKFDQAQSILNQVLSEQFYLLSVHNYLINDVDKHSENWFIIGDYKTFIDLMRENKLSEATELAKTFKISSIDNGASFAPTQQGRWDFFQTRNRMQYYKLPVAKSTKLNKTHIQDLYDDRKKFAQAIFDQYNGTEDKAITEKRLYCALERLSALHSFVLENDQRTIADMCQKIKYRDQINHYAHQSKREDWSIHQLTGFFIPATPAKWGEPTLYPAPAPAPPAYLSSMAARRESTASFKTAPSRSSSESFSEPSSDSDSSPSIRYETL